jgi:hypothetical protein
MHELANFKFTNFVKGDSFQENKYAIYYTSIVKRVGLFKFLTARLLPSELLQILLQIAHHIK